MNNVHLEVTNLSHGYGDISDNGLTLSGINLSLDQGELLGLLGPSGCGKTTLLRIIAGFEKPCEGSVVYQNKNISSPSYVLPPERRGIGMVFQDYALFPHLNVWKNICFGLTKKHDMSRANWLLELLGLREFRKRFPHELSGGQRQRLGLARALAPSPSLVLLDEPFSSLDVEVRYRLRNELSRVLNSCSASGILVTHDPQEALGICDRVAVMRKGSIEQCASAIDLLTKPKTPFVGNFVSQNNLINIVHKKDDFSTPFGSVIVKPYLLKAEPNILMVDQDSIEISYSENGKGLIKSREFNNNSWIFRVQYGEKILRVSMPIDSDLCIGNNCDIKFISGKYGYLFPGCISCVLKS
ncbi:MULTISPECIES: ABC transporter ATP-binding protein [Prochlorococcus]|uniref:ABC-type quaternary amine transporter n=1 Tax=Prochlorococcus marinus (strain SARG / CCMP1375 / SS120) TaxID=167539 RepID=Q7VC61_PROMA|nr:MULTISPECIES: ABC transporter ATP-binding protein [Prochlorococcus]AAP99925.1 ABC-type spermidine/putrescine transport system ATPase component [Prochlorococcus marinus subsp. marinus str. CCMP1375]KGG11727.1 ABC transporter [Prochlorococcus marinus str. LG]KGG18859.1 ABC transporter [Prochlorococcus marinus str. SS2]KGG23603.1 ABC transporter [Prochlorococcus marinus str. SS35]KGG32161.1 ABC transporter [Prochlorococcus marinus str. SS51]